MASIADTFLADFESSGDEEEEENLEEEEEKKETVKKEKEKSKKSKDVDVEPEILPFEEEESEVLDLDVTLGLVTDETQIKEDESMEIDAPNGIPKETKYENTATAVSTLLNEPELQSHLEQISQLMLLPEDEVGLHSGPGTDRGDEYNVIVRSNELTIEIDNEIAAIHKYMRDIYSTKYQELEQLVPNPMEYAQVVKIIGNETDMSLVEKELAGIVPNHTILTILVTATTTIGKPLPKEDLKKVFDAADMIIKLDEAKKKLFEYVESRMSFVAPNLTALVGAEVAARLMASAGGLRNISEIPSCNLQVLGKQRKQLAGFSTQVSQFHMGLLATTDMIAGCPPSLRQRAMRLLAGKCTLAARVDNNNQDASGAVGQKYREDIEGRIHKWQEPPPPKPPKPLPVPLPPPRKKRGGKRYRKQKELYKATELQKQKNRLPFGTKAEVTDEFTGEGFGMLGVAGGGRLAVKKENKQKLSQKLSRKTQAKLRRVKTASSGTSGLASSIAFTPVQGIELVDRDAMDKNKQIAQNKYFSNTSGFFRVGTASKRKQEEDRLEKINKVERIKAQKAIAERHKKKRKAQGDENVAAKRGQTDKDVETQNKLKAVPQGQTT